MKLSPNALKILGKRYLKKDEKERPVETPEEMFRRVARAVSRADERYRSQKEVRKIEEEFYSVMSRLEFIPNSPTLMNAGRKLGQLSACFVLPIEDSIESIFGTIKDMARIHQSGGGTGFSFSRLRPKGDIVSSTMGPSSGPISFMEAYNTATETIKQGGTRRGANMGILSVDHPDILDFIACKRKEGKFVNFNISVAIPDRFMKAVEEDKKWELINPRTKKIVARISARRIFGLITEMIWRNGEPGVIFIDRINRDNPTPELGRIESTNPCGEAPLLPYESCILGSINLSKMVVDGEIDWKKLKKTIRAGVHFLDNVIDVNKYPLKEIKEMTLGNRKIGLGVMGFADMLIRLGIPYNSEEAVKMAEKIMSFISWEAKKKSQELAKERDPFSNCRKSIYSRGPKMRNATRTTIAPTGSISIIADCSSGIEPLYGITYLHEVLDEVRLLKENPLFKEIAKREGFYSAKLMKKISRKGSVQGLKGIPRKYQRLFVTAPEISYKWHIKIQAAFQKYTDNAVSKTINFGKEIKKGEVREAILLAYKSGLKGLTAYRQGSRARQALSYCGYPYCVP
jgi:ribonucleoside-diphosphate reductase alpha chain